MSQSKSRKQLPYEQKLLKAMEKFSDACAEIASLAHQHELHQSHVADVQKFTQSRVAELKKQVEYRRPQVEVSLSPIEDEDSQSKESTKDLASTSRPGGFARQNADQSSAEVSAQV